jgi:hypothetical protein
MDEKLNRLGSEKAVVVEGGAKVVSTHETEGDANAAAAARRKKLQEQQGQSAPIVETKQQLFS